MKEVGTKYGFTPAVTWNDLYTLGGGGGGVDRFSFLPSLAFFTTLKESVISPRLVVMVMDYLEHTQTDKTSETFLDADIPVLTTPAVCVTHSALITHTFHFTTPHSNTTS